MNEATVGQIANCVYCISYNDVFSQSCKDKAVRLVDPSSCANPNPPCQPHGSPRRTLNQEQPNSAMLFRGWQIKSSLVNHVISSIVMPNEIIMFLNYNMLRRTAVAGLMAAISAVGAQVPVVLQRARTL